MELLLDPATSRLPHIFFKGAAHAGECHKALEGHAEGGPKTHRSLYNTVSPSKTYIKDSTKQQVKAKEIKSTWDVIFFRRLAGCKTFFSYCFLSNSKSKFTQLVQSLYVVKTNPIAFHPPWTGEPVLTIHREKTASAHESLGQPRVLPAMFGLPNLCPELLWVQPDEAQKHQGIDHTFFLVYQVEKR